MEGRGCIGALRVGVGWIGFFYGDDLLERKVTRPLSFWPMAFAAMPQAAAVFLD
jgi:hypothetical protein